MLSYLPKFVTLNTACYQFYQLLDILATRLVTLLERVMPSVLLISALLVNSGLHPPRPTRYTLEENNFFDSKFCPNFACQKVEFQKGTCNLPN